MFIKQGKTNIKYLLIVAVLAAVIGGGILWCITKQEMPSIQLPEIKTPEDETADWKTYRNEEYGFEFKYPEVFDRFDNCKLIEEDNFIRIGSRFAISILDSNGLTLSEHVLKEKEESLHGQVFPPPEEAWQQEDIYMGDIKGIKVIWFHGPRYSQIIFFLKDNTIFDIAFTAGIPCLSYYVDKGFLDENEAQYELDIFEQMLSTFRFIEEDLSIDFKIIGIDEETGWNIGRSNNYNFEFKYPEDFFWNEPAITVDDCDNVDYPGNCPNVDGPQEKQEEITVNGTPYCLFTFIDAAAGSSFFEYSYTTKKRGKCFTLELKIGYSNCSNYADDEEVKKCEEFKETAPKIINQVVSTFRFLQ